MARISTPEQSLQKADRLQRVKRTMQQALITAFVAVYPILVTATSWGALWALLPALGFVAVMTLVTDVYNRVKPAS